MTTVNAYSTNELGLIFMIASVLIVFSCTTMAICFCAIACPRQPSRYIAEKHHSFEMDLENGRGIRTALPTYTRNVSKSSGKPCYQIQ